VRAGAQPAPQATQATEAVAPPPAAPPVPPEEGSPVLLRGVVFGRSGEIYGDFMMIFIEISEWNT